LNAIQVSYTSEKKSVRKEKKQGKEKGRGIRGIDDSIWPEEENPNGR